MSIKAGVPALDSCVAGAVVQHCAVCPGSNWTLGLWLFWVSDSLHDHRFSPGQGLSLAENGQGDRSKLCIAADVGAVLTTVDGGSYRLWQRRFMVSKRGFCIAAALLVFVLAGCTSAPEEEGPPTIRQSAEGLIETDVAEVAGLGELSPVCADVINAVVGTTFDCTATTEDNRVVSVSARIDELGRISLATNNMITAAALPSFERAAVDALNATVGSDLMPEAVDCGSSSVVLGPEQVMTCALLDPLTESIFDVSLTISDIEARQFSLLVADEPRA